MYRTIVVPLGRDADAVTAVAHGAAIARQAGAELELLTVRPAYTAVGADRDRAGNASRHRVTNTARRNGIGRPDAYRVAHDSELDLAAAAHRHGVAARLRIVEGSDPASAIGEVAAAADTLVCLKTHARGAVGEMTLGSVSEQVIRSSPRPVLLVGPRCGPPPERYESIVAGLDGSALAEQILPTLVDWSWRLDLTPWLLQVLPISVPVVAGREDFYDSVYVHRLADRLLVDHDVKAEWDTIHTRRVAAAIARFGGGLPGSVIALTTRGRSGYSRLVLGSVALEVAHRSAVPVLIQPSQPPRHEKGRRG